MRGIKTNLITVMVIGLIGMLTGCSILSGIETAGNGVNAVGQLVVEEAAALVIQAGCKATAAQTAQQCYDANAAKVLTVATTLESATGSMVITDVQALVTQKIASLNLTPAEVAPLNVFAGQVFQYLAPIINNSKVLTAANLAIVDQVATWVADEAALYSPAAAPAAAKIKAAARKK